MKIKKILTDLDVARFHLVNAMKLLKQIKDVGYKDVEEIITKIDKLTDERIYNG